MWCKNRTLVLQIFASIAETCLQMVSGDAPNVYTVHRCSGSKANEFRARSLLPHCTSNGSLPGEILVSNWRGWVEICDDAGGAPGFKSNTACEITMRHWIRMIEQSWSCVHHEIRLGMLIQHDDLLGASPSQRVSTKRQKPKTKAN